MNTATKSKTKKKTTSGSLRVSQELFILADRIGNSLERSAARQIEFWANLGRAVEAELTGREINAIMGGKAKVSTVKKTPSQPSLLDRVAQEIEQDRKDGRLAEKIIQGDTWYGASEDEGFLLRHEKSGQTTLGRFEGVSFKPERPKQKSRKSKSA